MKLEPVENLGNYVKTMHTQVDNTVKICGETKNFVERMKENRKLKL